MRCLILFIILNGFIGLSQENTFFNVARKGTIEDAKKWVVQKPKVVNKSNEQGFYPLILACYNGNKAMVAFLMDNYNYVNINYVSPEGSALMGDTIKGNVKIAAFY
jgi:ankyrin repeat protein